LQPFGSAVLAELATATERQSPLAVLVRKETTVSMAAAAAEAADDEPRASMMAARAFARS